MKEDMAYVILAFWLIFGAFAIGRLAEMDHYKFVCNEEARK